MSARWITHDVLLAFYDNYVPILYLFSGYSQILVESHKMFSRVLFDTPNEGDSLEFTKSYRNQSNWADAATFEKVHFKVRLKN